MASLRRLAREARFAIERAAGVHLVRSDYHGFSDCDDVLRSGVEVRTVVDVGANVGGVAREYLRRFPRARVHCFEPVPSTFARLSANLAGQPRAVLNPTAVGSESGRAVMYVGANDLTNSMAHVQEGSSATEVDVTTIDRYCSQASITSIDLLKIDAEGFDVEVLKGASGMFRAKAVRFVLVEVTPNPGVAGHVHLDAVRSIVEPSGFRLYGLYDQVLAWDGRPMMQFANALFRLQ